MSNIWYGSLNNRLMERTISPEPEVGMGVTECLWSDREPWEIIEVKDARHIIIRKLDTSRVDNNGMSECQEYEYKSNPSNITFQLYKNNKGRWVRRVGRNGVDKSSGWFVGRAEKYYDFTI